MQVMFNFFLSIAWGANHGHLSMPVFHMIKDIYTSDAVPETITMACSLHAASLVGMTLGTLLWGARLTPITGEHPVIS